MAQIGYGYGSEYHLMRFLGHHRDLFEKRIKKALNEEGEIHWIDFEFDSPMASISGDKELKGLSFLEKIDLPKEKVKSVISDYHTYDINGIDNWQNWDAVFTLNGIIYLVEAKAHTSELSSGGNEHGGESKEEILRFFTEQLKESKYQIPVSRTWLKNYYQFANRLATAALLNKHEIEARVLYVYFTNGFDKRIVEDQKIFRVYEDNATIADFERAIKKEKKNLSIIGCETVNALLAPPVFIKADSKDYDD